MDESYVPVSPDLSALHHNSGPSLDHDHAPAPTSDPALHTRESFSLPASARPAWLASHHPQQEYDHHSSFAPPESLPQPAYLQPQLSSDYGVAAAAPPAEPQPRASGRGRRKKEVFDGDYVPPSPLSPVSQAAPAATAPTMALSGDPRPLPEIKTKFPIARIKRIVQADEDVGKVAQATPVAVSKALEQFMISLARRSADEARARGSKKVTALDMKGAVGKDEVFDFLSEVVERIPDAPTRRGGGAAAAHKDTDSDDEAGAGPRKKRKAAGRRKKAEASDDD